VADELRAALNGPVLAMCVGPVCRKAAVEAGVHSAVEPQLPRIGGMVKALADELQSRRRELRVDEVDAVTFTAAPAVHNLFAMATAEGVADDLRAALNGPVLAMCVGPVCRKAAVEVGVHAAAEPQLPRIGGMVKTLADELQSRRRELRVDEVHAVVQGSMVRASGTSVSLPSRERSVFETLARRPGAVVPKRVLLVDVWGSAETDPHALEVTVGRLRRRLAPTGLGVEAVHRRGYRLTAGRTGPGS
jgi:uroporphyrinogen-III synthase